jgi:hypothetical protein
MRKTIFLSFLISITFTILSMSNVLCQNNSKIIGAIDDKVSLKRDGDQYLITYQNYNLDSDKANNKLIFEDKAKVDKLYLFIMEGFESMKPGPVQFEMKKNDLRLYYKNKFIGRDLVEIIHENKETEETGTFHRLSKKDVQQLFGMQ